MDRPSAWSRSGSLSERSLAVALHDGMQQFPVLVALRRQGVAEEVDVGFGAVAVGHLAEGFGEGLFGLVEHAQIDVQVHGRPPSGAF